MLEGRKFSIYTDRRHLTDAFKQKPDKCSPRQLRHLDLISQFSTDIRHVKGTENIVADALSRIEIHAISNKILNFHEISLSQLHDSELQKLLTSNIIIEKHYFPLEDVTLYCDVSTNSPRPYIPKSFRSTIFENIHNLSHPGIRATRKLITKR
ncbi:hypothetical protein AVEN_46542-1 [Araneus ventricosus]|uniref:Integrase zinc-binding domain-containing protein n=1 Tax=Araneus ventricosus TaxID=182803 RepID=A0A4Y2RGZ8_ARAVE|nr:hypothetical protein AVEN_252681-1 [Araneus ventricosus]GBN74700.1 hypothetical protein AVEN_46542-1 [Araneus ventricosus]